MTTNKKIAPRKAKAPVADKASIEAKIATPSVTTPKPTIKSLQAELAQANTVIEMLEKGLNTGNDIIKILTDKGAEEARERAEYKRKYLEEVNRSWWDITKERFVESLYRFKV